MEVEGVKNAEKRNDIQVAYENLANAIIVQAVLDYRKAIHRLKKYPFDHEARGARISALKFFRSDWYRQLTDVDGERLIRILNKEVE